MPYGTPLASGAVEVVLHIDAQGIVTKAELKSGLGSPYDAAVQRAALAFKYEPARQKGKAIAIAGPIAFGSLIF